MKVAAKEIEALPAFSEVNHSGLFRMQLQPQPRQHLAGKLSGRPSLGPAATSHDEIVRIADENAMSPVSKRLIQRVQIDV